MFLRSKKISSFIVLFSIVVFFSSAASLSLAQGQEQALGEIKIEGDHIESLVLRSLDDWHTESFEPPFESKKIPVGKYRLQNIRLEGGYYCGTKNNITISVTKDETAIFKIGAPLKHTVKVERRGRALLVLTYKLLGMAGEDYTIPTRNNPPGFTIFKSDKEIASGKFQYG